MGLIRAILDASKIVQEERDQAAAEGFAKGLAEQSRNLLRRFLGKRFPELKAMPEIEMISDVSTLEAIVVSVFESREVEPVRAAILAAAKENAAFAACSD